MTTPAAATVVCLRPDDHASYADPSGQCMVCAAVAVAPPLSPEQKAGLGAIWRPAVQRYLESENGSHASGRSV